MRVRGKVKEDRRAPSGVEIQLPGFTLLFLTQDFPITPKEHGTAFLMEHRHLWLRSSRQRSRAAGAQRGRAGRSATSSTSATSP